MQVIRVSVIAEGIKGRDRKVKRHFEKLTDIQVEDASVFQAIVKDQVKTYLDANFNYTLLDAYKKKFKKLDKIMLEINHVTISGNENYSSESYMPLAAKYAVVA